MFCSCVVDLAVLTLVLILFVSSVLIRSGRAEASVLLRDLYSLKCVRLRQKEIENGGMT